MKYNLHRHIKKYIATKKSPKLALIGSIFLSIVFIQGAFLYSHTATVHDAELRFAEVSNNKNIKGSVVPASCESYPSWGPSHHGAKTFSFTEMGNYYEWTVPADTSGYCAGTVPVNGVCGTSINGCAAGRGAVLPTSDAAGYYWWCGGTNVGAYWGTDAWCSAMNGACGATANTCSGGRGYVAATPSEDASNYFWWCGGSNGASDIWCSTPKAAPPSVNINFQ